MTVQIYRKFLEAKQSEKILLTKQLADKKDAAVRKKRNVEYLLKARWVLAEAAKITQQQFSECVQNMVTMAIQAVYGLPLKFLVNFEIKRNKAECQLLVQEGDKEPFVPKDEMGGGLLDVISFALRVVLWSLERPRSNNVLLLDEPLKFLGKGELLNKAAIMVKDISHRLGLQIIINTHEPELLEIADRGWMVSYDGIKSSVEEISETA